MKKKKRRRMRRRNSEKVEMKLAICRTLKVKLLKLGRKLGSGCLRPVSFHLCRVIITGEAKEVAYSSIGILATQQTIDNSALGLEVTRDIVIQQLRLVSCNGCDRDK